MGKRKSAKQSEKRKSANESEKSKVSDTKVESVQKNKSVRLKGVTKKKNVKKYNAGDVRDALNAMDKEGQGLREAANRFGVPKSTLYGKLHNLSPVDCRKGPSTVLTNEEESDIVKWILFCAGIGFPITKVTLLDNVQKFITEEIKKGKRTSPFKENRPGKHWYDAFMRRHPNLSKRIAQNLTSTRAAVTEKDLRNWFSQVKNYLEKKNLLAIEPDRIFNLDESSCMLVPKDNTVITEKGVKAPHQIVAGNEKACLTVLFTTAASGRMPPPMILFDLKTTPKKTTLEQIPKGWGVGNTERGWMTSDSFYSYITNIFFKWLKDNKYVFPIILYVDGHSSHLTLPLVKFCEANDIQLVVLYPNATHLIQPLDVAVFHPLKDAYRKVLRQWRIDNNIVDVKKSMFASILKLALESIDLTKSIKNGFRTCGLYPFNPDAVNYNVFNNKKERKESDVPSSPAIASSEDSNMKVLLQVFESKLISESVLKDFKKDELSESWSGETKYEELFESWRKLKGLSIRKDEQDDTLMEGAENLTSPDHTIDDHYVDSNVSIESVANKSFSPFGHDYFDKVREEDLQDLILRESANNQMEVNDSIDIISERFIDPLVLESSQSNTNVTQSTDRVELHGQNVGDVEFYDESGNRRIVTIVAVISEGTEDNTASPISLTPITTNSIFSSVSTSKEDASQLEVNNTDSNEISNNADNISDLTENFYHAHRHFENSCTSSASIECPSDSIDTVLDLTTDYKVGMDFSKTASIKRVTESVQVVIGVSVSEATNDSTQSFNDKPEQKSVLVENSINIDNSAKIVNNTSKSSISNKSKKELDILPQLKSAFPVPNFQSKKKKNKSEPQDGPSCHVVDNLLEALEKKEQEKKAKEQQILQNKQDRERKRVVKEKEQDVMKTLQEIKKNLQQKKEKKSEIQKLKKALKLENDKENKIQLEQQLQQLVTQLEETEESLISQEMIALQSKLKIKQEKL